MYHAAGVSCALTALVTSSGQKAEPKTVVELSYTLLLYIIININIYSVLSLGVIIPLPPSLS